MGFSKIKKIAPGTRWLWCIHTTREVRTMKSGRDLTVLETTQTQGEKLLCAPKHFQCETQRRGWRQHISDQRGNINQGAWQWSQHTYNLPCHILYQDHSKLKRFNPKKRLILFEKKLQAVHSSHKLHNLIWTVASFAIPQDSSPHIL